jgi:hypothetical protein
MLKLIEHKEIPVVAAQNFRLAKGGRPVLVSSEFHRFVACRGRLFADLDRAGYFKI